MASRKVKHAQALERREAFFKTVHQGNEDWLKKAQTQRIEDQKKADQVRKDRAVAKSKRLAKAHKARPQRPQEA